MQRLLPALLALTLAAGPPAPDQPAPRITVTTANQPGPNFWVKIHVSSAPGGPDSLLYSVRQGATTVIAATRRAATVLRDSFSLVKPAIGATATGNGCVQSKRRGLLSTVACATYSFTTPDTPPEPPVVDVSTDTLVIALKILPHSATFSILTQQQYCPVFTMGDGKRGMPNEFLALPYCKTLFEAEVPLLNRATLGQRLYLDHRGVSLFRVAL